MKRSRLDALLNAIRSIRVAVDDATALSVPALYPEWREDGTSTAGDRVLRGGILYRCLLDHTAQAAWAPTDAPSLWARVLIPDPEVIPEWVQPDSTNPYSKGDKVTHNGKTWVSDLDGNVWEPGVYGWTEVDE